MKRMKDESGQALAIIAVALSIPCILGFVALATDVGVLLQAKRHMQIAADAAAVAGAKEIRVQGATAATIKAAAKAASAQNGYADGSNGVTVAASYPPADGPHTGQAGYAEAIVTQIQPTFFMKLFNITSMPVAARAVAFDGATDNVGCLRAQDTTGADTIHLQGSFSVDAPGCSVIDNSSSAGALTFTGGGGSLVAGYVGVVGTATGQTGDSSPAPTTGIPQTSDPLASQISPPTYTAGSCTAAPSGNTWGPATAGGTVCYSGSISVKNNVTMNAGVYVITGNLDLGGHGSLTGTGVTIYIAPGGSLGGGGNGNTTLNLTAPTSGAYNGILIYEDASNTNTVSLNGTPIANLTGIIYVPSGELDLSGNTNVNLTSDLIVGSLYDKGNASINITDYTKTFGGPLTTIALVE